MRDDLPKRLTSKLQKAQIAPGLRRLIEREVIPALHELRAIEADTVVIPRLYLDKPASEQGLGDADPN